MKIGFLGMGVMGLPMAKNVVKKSGCEVLGYDVAKKQLDDFCSPLTGVTTNSGDTPTGYRVHDACRGSSVFRGCRLSISCCWLSTKPMPL